MTLYVWVHLALFAAPDELISIFASGLFLAYTLMVIASVRQSRWWIIGCIASTCTILMCLLIEW